MEKLQSITKGKKHNLKRQSKYQNQTWQGCWNYQTENFKTTMINTLRALMDKVDNMQEQMGNVSREMEILRTKKEILEIKNTNRNKDCLDGLISRLDTAKEII